MENTWPARTLIYRQSRQSSHMVDDTASPASHRKGRNPMASPPRRGTIGQLAVLACAPAMALAIAWPAAGAAAAASPPSAYVDVSVATVWTAPALIACHHARVPNEVRLPYFASSCEASIVTSAST
jgi:hypothetical protein